LKAKRREAIYIQAAVITYKILILLAYTNSFLQGAVMFSTVTGTLQWPDLDSRYWLGPACWYSSLVLAIAAVILAAQQTILLETLESNYNLECYREHFWGTTHPRGWLLFAWQAPFMLLNYSIFLFLIGLCSHIGSPFAFTREFDGDAKVRRAIPTSNVFPLTRMKIMVFYIVVSALSFLVFVTTSRTVHQTVAVKET